MTASERENIVTDYLLGNMTEQEKINFKQLLKTDESLRQKLNEQQVLWNAMDLMPEPQNTETTDQKFYAMLSRQTSALPPKKATGRIRQMSYWWASSAAVIVFALAYGLGRYSKPAEQMVKYKTVKVIERVAAQPRYVTVYKTLPAVKQRPVQLITSKPAAGAQNTSALVAQFRSPYSSVRIGAALAAANSNLSEADLNALGTALKHDTDPNVQLAIVQSLQPKANQQAIQRLLINALPFVQSTVQSSVIDILFANKAREAIPQMLAILHNDSTSYQTQGQIKLGIEELIN